jgi:Flp pilus assembly protein TadG
MIVRHRHRRPLSRLGAASVELAVLLPFLLYMAVIAVDWARLLYYAISIENCARAGALFACDPITQAQSPYTSVVQAARAEAPGLDPVPNVTSVKTIDSTGTWFTVTASANYKTITNFPGVPQSQPISRAVKMRAAPVTTR